MRGSMSLYIYLHVIYFSLKVLGRLWTQDNIFDGLKLLKGYDKI